MERSLPDACDPDGEKRAQHAELTLDDAWFAQPIRSTRPPSPPPPSIDDPIADAWFRAR